MAIIEMDMTDFYSNFKADPMHDESKRPEECFCDGCRSYVAILAEKLANLEAEDGRKLLRRTTLTEGLYSRPVKCGLIDPRKYAGDLYHDDESPETCNCPACIEGRPGRYTESEDDEQTAFLLCFHEEE